MVNALTVNWLETAATDWVRNDPSLRPRIDPILLQLPDPGNADSEHREMEIAGRISILLEFLNQLPANEKVATVAPTPKNNNGSKKIDFSEYPRYSEATRHMWVSSKKAAQDAGFRSTSSLAEYRKKAHGATRCDDGRGIDKFGQVFSAVPNAHPVYLQKTLRKNPKKNPGNPG